MAWDEDLTFTSFVAFGAHVEWVRVAAPRAIANGLREAAENILYRTQQKFGTYHGQVGPFSAWRRLTKETMRRRRKRGINPLEQPLLESERLKDSYEINVDSGNLEAAVGSPLPYAVVQEAGDPLHNIPPRPALGPAVLQYEREHQDYFEEGLAEWFLQGRYFRRLRSRHSTVQRSSRSVYGNTDFVMGEGSPEDDGEEE